MRDRIGTLAVAALALVATSCEKRTADPKPDRSVSANVVSSRKLVPSALSSFMVTGRSVTSASPVTSGRSPPGSGPPDCEERHWQNPWRPRQTSENPVRRVACEGPGCVSLEPVVSKGERCPDRCRRVTVTPRVTSPDPARNERIQKLLDAQIVDVTDDDCWLTFLDYTVHHDANGVLDVTFRMSGLGAYPSTQTAHATIDIATGSRLRALNVFSSRALPALTAAMSAKVLAAWRRAAREHAEVFRGREAPRYASEHLDDFIVHPDGVTFFFDYGLPHAVELAMPASEFPWSKRDIARFIDPEGPLRFLRDAD